tara:strand:- start:1040 stop:1210 length:171 start_codon:yes stop_codon:yes gene_type:complete
MANRIKVKAIGLSLVAIFILTACGQKRALYLPEEPATNNTSQDSQDASESAEEGKD